MVVIFPSREQPPLSRNDRYETLEVATGGINLGQSGMDFHPVRPGSHPPH
jgi:hypothetical protein